MSLVRRLAPASTTPVQRRGGVARCAPPTCARSAPRSRRRARGAHRLHTVRAAGSCHRRASIGVAIPQSHTQGPHGRRFCGRPDPGRWDRPHRGLLNLSGSLGALLAFACHWAVAFFRCLVGTALGKPPFHAPDFTDFFSNLVAPALRAFAASAIAFIPAALYARSQPDHTLHLGDPVDLCSCSSSTGPTFRWPC